MRDGSATASSRRAHGRPVLAALTVLVVYFSIASLNSTGGYLGTDTGAKVITLDRMAENDTESPAIGYWAEEWDPDGDYHPLYDTRRNADGEWINVTTLPMLIAALPLYEVGGYRLALLLPMLGGLLASFACRDIARGLAGERSGWWTFWIVSLASPITVYALDLWEHSLGAGFMVAAVALLLRARESPRWWLLSIGAGLLLGTSATMRAESFVVAFVAVAAACITLLWKRRFAATLAVGALTVSGFALPWLANAALEAQVGGNSRAARVGREAQREWWTELGERAEEALITWLAIPNLRYPGNVVLGALIVGSILAAVVAQRRGLTQRVWVLLVLAAATYLVALSGGLAFVPGALVAAPFAAVALIFVRQSPERRLVVASALGMTVLIWLFQLTGGAGPQWGGRYILVPTLLLTTVGIVGLSATPRGSGARVGVAALAVAVTGFGLIWLNHRSHEVDEYFQVLAGQTEDVVVFANGFLVREAGPAYAERHYLSVGRRGTLAGATRVVRASGAESIGIVSDNERPPSIGARHIGTAAADLLGEPLWYHRYDLMQAGPGVPEP